MTHTFKVHKQAPMTRERYRSFFSYCEGCGIVRDNRSGVFLSETDAQELEEIMSDYFHPPIPAGDQCPWCINHEANKNRGMR